ncbi:hypothetical protein PRIPAC_80353 [Pristionchus pacificus]|nr:hypothetical protein PRIPAC_80353 [Pristionchus pacificus]
MRSAPATRPHTPSPLAATTTARPLLLAVPAATGHLQLQPTLYKGHLQQLQLFPYRRQLSRSCEEGIQWKEEEEEGEEEKREEERKERATAHTPLLQLTVALAKRRGRRRNCSSNPEEKRRRMSSYGAIGDEQDELDRLLAAQAPGGRPIRGTGLRRVASAAEARRGQATTPMLTPDSRVRSGTANREVPVVGSVERRGPYLYTGGIGLDNPLLLGGSTLSLNALAGGGGGGVTERGGGGGSGGLMSPASGATGSGLASSEDMQRAHAEASRAHNMAIRYRLFNRLDPGGETLRMPDHVIPSQYFSILPFDDFMDSSGKQGSFVTIFSLWNTMMGTSLLAMPWAMQQAGLVLGIGLMLSIAALCLFTAYLVVQSPKGLAMEVDGAQAEFSDVCRYLFGPWGERISVWFSVVVLLGGVMVYWVLMSNFLFHTGNVVYEALQPNSSTIPIMENKTFTCDIYCPDAQLYGHRDQEFSLQAVGDVLTSKWDFDSLWQLQLTVPIYLFVLCFPLLNFKSPTFFTKFNVLGTVSVFYLLSFTASKLVECGVNLDFVNKASIHYASMFSWKFPALTGTLTLSYFIHNAVLTILRNQKHPENNARDLTIGYGLAAFCYVFIGFTFYAAFPVQRSCIADNFLNNFGTGDVMSATARLFLLFQMLTVLPLLMYLIRTQFFYATMGTTWPGLSKVCTLNAVVCGLAVSMAIFYPKVGSILRYVGSFSGLVYVFALPCLVYMKKLQLDGLLTKRVQYALYFIIFLGALNMVAQFVI